MYEAIIEKLRQSKTSLVAVSKTKSNSDILNIYEKGQRLFGENRVSELVSKYESLPKDISWHMIGHLQSKKVKSIAPFIDLIHSVDSFSLLNKIDQEAAKNHRQISVLLQFKIAEEESKYGFEIDEVVEKFSEIHPSAWKNITFKGVMGMATFTDNETQIKKEFQNLNRIFNILKSQFFKDTSDFKELSMGMSSDYLLAINEGSTMVRIGSLIFGDR